MIEIKCIESYTKRYTVIINEAHIVSIKRSKFPDCYEIETVNSNTTKYYIDQDQYDLLREKYRRENPNFIQSHH